MPASRTSLTLRSLGKLEALINGHTKNIGARPILIALYLAANERRSVTRRELVDVFWPASSPQKGRHSLSQALHAIRSLAPDIISTPNNDEVCLICDVVWDYDDLLTALGVGSSMDTVASIPGTFLDQVFVDGSSAFEDWRSNLASILRNKVVAYFVNNLDVSIVRSEWIKVANAAVTLSTVFGVEIDSLSVGQPIRESILELINGRQSRFSSIVNSNPSASTTPLVGRSSEIKKMLEAFRKADSGFVHVSLTGEAGIGKSRLANAVVDVLSLRQAFSLRVRCYENNKSSGLSAIIEALRDNKLAVFVPRLSEPWKTVISSLLNEQGVHEQLNGDERQQFVFEALVRFFEVVSQHHPIVLLIDDLQWSGPSVASFISHLRGGRAAIKMLLVTAKRNDTDARLTSQASPGAEPDLAIRLNALSSADIYDFAQQLKLDDASTRMIAHTLYSRTSGNPYLLTEVARAIHNGHKNVWTPANIQVAIRESVTDYLFDSISSLAPKSRHLLSVLAVLGKPTEFAIVRRVSAMRHPTFLIALQELLDRNLVIDTNGAIEPSHDLIRQATYEQLGVTHRRTLHRRAARILFTVQRLPFAAVSHFISGGQRRQAYLASLKAARMSERHGADNDADLYLTHAVRTCRSPRKRYALTWRRARFWFERNQLAKATHLYDSLIRNGPLPAPRRAEIETRLLEAAFFTGSLKLDELHCRLRSLADRTRTRDAVHSHVIALRTMVRLRVQAGEAAEATLLRDELIKVADDFPRTAPGVEALRWASHLLIALGQSEEAEGSLKRAMAWATSLQDKPLIANVMCVQILIHLNRGDLRGALKSGQEAVRLCEESGLFRQRNILLANMSTIALDMADYAYAECLIQEVIKSAQTHQNFSDLGRLHANYALLEFERGDYQHAKLRAQSALDASERVRDEHVIKSMRAILGQVALNEGRLAEARRRFEEIMAAGNSVTGDDVVGIEQFVSRMLEHMGRAREAVERIELITGNPNFNLNACCKKGLDIELARLLAKRDPTRAMQLAASVSAWAEERGAACLARQAESLLIRIENSRASQRLPHCFNAGE